MQHTKNAEKMRLEILHKPAITTSLQRRRLAIVSPMTNVKVYVLALWLVLVQSVFGQTIDFESVPGIPAPIDGMAISNQYEATFGVSFIFEDGHFPYLAKVGPPRTAFQGPNGGDDNVQPNQGVGEFFLTDDFVTNNLGTAPAPLLVTYTTPVAAASGVIIDVDEAPGGVERWIVEALNTNNVLLVSNRVTVNNAFSGNGKATPWSFQRPTSDIQRIRIWYNGTKANGIGLAFDNFSPALPVAPARLALTPSPTGAVVEINGMIGGNYLVEYVSSLSATNWNTLTNLVLPETPHTISDGTATNVTSRFYRVTGF